MRSNRPTVAELAKEAQMDLDEALVTLWDAGFSGLTGPTDAIPKGEANRARRALGVATRRELESIVHWQLRLKLTADQFDDLIRHLEIKNPFHGGTLRKHAIRRLQAESRLLVDRPPHRDEPDSPVVPAAPPTPFKWESVGHFRDLVFLSEQDLLDIHHALVADFRDADDPIEPAGPRNRNILASAVSRPQTSLGDMMKYPTVEMAGAALFHSLVHNHPFHNGNKRTALVSLLVFLDENGLLLTCHEDLVFKTVLQIAQHSFVEGPRQELPDREVLALAKWIKEHSRLIEKGDRAITWRKLQQILTRYGCRFQVAGSNVTIRRTVDRRYKYLPFISKSRDLHSHTHVSGGGRDITQHAVSKIRRELQLDDDSGIDSKAFYEDEEISASDFIARYRKTLRRLARL
jgi:death-on-curing family protein